MGRWGDYKPSEREPICPLYLTALPPSRGLAVFQLLLSLSRALSLLASLAYINCLLPLGLELGNSLNKHTCAQSQVLPVLQLAHLPPPPSLNASTLKVSFDASSSLSPKTNHQLTLLFPSKYLIYFIYLLGPVRERIWNVCSKDLCSNTRLSTCWPCEIEVFLLQPPASCPLPPGLHSQPTQDPPTKRAMYTLPALLPTLCSKARCSPLPT